MHLYNIQKCNYRNQKAKINIQKQMQRFGKNKDAIQCNLSIVQAKIYISFSHTLKKCIFNSKRMVLSKLHTPEIFTN